MPGLNPRQHKFCELVAAGQTGTDAYFAAFPRCKSRSTASTESSRLRARPEVRECIEQLTREARENAKTDVVTSQRELIRFLTDVLRTPAGQLNEDNPLCQSVRLTSTGAHLQMPCKMKAVDRLSRMLGLDKPGEKEDGLVTLIREIRARGGEQIREREAASRAAAAGNTANSCQ